MTRRTLTLLFTDLVGSTSLLSGLSEHEAQGVRRAHFAELREQVDRRGGREVKNLGDGVMAVFEATRDGIEAAVAMQVAAARSRSGLSIRVGLSSGDVRVEDGDCFGLPVVEASRLCARAAGGQVLLSESTRLLARDYGPLAPVGEISLKGLPEPTTAWEVPWAPSARPPVRVVLADDAVLLREGIARVLEEHGIEVLAQAGDGEELIRLTEELRPDLAIVDIRMPPTYTAEGIEAAEAILARHPGTGVLILSQDLHPRYAGRLLEANRDGVGYLLKERVANVREFAEAARTVAGGGTVFEPALQVGLQVA